MYIILSGVTWSMFISIHRFCDWFIDSYPTSWSQENDMISESTLLIQVAWFRKATYFMSLRWGFLRRHAAMSLYSMVGKGRDLNLFLVLALSFPKLVHHPTKNTERSCFCMVDLFSSFAAAKLVQPGGHQVQPLCPCSNQSRSHGMVKHLQQNSLPRCQHRQWYTENSAILDV